MPSTNQNETLRIRVFAGPNGSGKSTVIKSIKDITVKGKPIDFGIYVNADDIAKDLKNNGLSFSRYHIKATQEEFTGITLSSGLIGTKFPEAAFKKSFSIRQNKILSLSAQYSDRLAQILAFYLVKKLIKEKKKCSFETVFSHSSKLDIMREAKATGYKVYLYFVATDSPEINIDRVKYRVEHDGGHDVPVDLIKKRYYKSLDQLFIASQIAYQVFFFDNSTANKQKMFAHFKIVKGKKDWDEMDMKDIPNWFIRYYSNKVKKRKK